MPHEVNLLDQLSLATPCGEAWDAMTGDERVRICDKCRLRVYNLTGMIPLEAEQFLTAREGAGCPRIYRRVDGSILTRDCPRGIRRARLATVAVIGVAALFLFAMEQYGSYVRIRNTETYDMTSLEPFVRFRPAPSFGFGSLSGNAPYVFGQSSGPFVRRHRPHVVPPNPSRGYPALPGASSSYGVAQSSMQQQLAAHVQQLSQQYPGSYGPAPAPAAQPSDDESSWQAFEAAMKFLKQRSSGPSGAQSNAYAVPHQLAPATSQPVYPGDNLIP